MIDGDDDDDNKEAGSIELNAPLLIRLLEYAREDAPKGTKGDIALHKIVERAMDLSEDEGCLMMEDYEELIKGRKDDDDDDDGNEEEKEETPRGTPKYPKVAKEYTS